MRRLYTAAGESVPETPWNDYPRPQMVRRDWLCLNGEWDFTANGREGKITVPFCAESLLSGAEKPVPCGQELIYRRRFSLPASWTGRRVLIRFGAVNRTAAVWCNGREICRHDNGYLPFSGELTDALLPGENELTVHVVNDLSHSFPWGKQSMDRGGMWYTPVTGIWQTVWLEPVPREYIRSLDIRTGADRAEITAEGVRDGVVRFEGREIPLTDGRAVIRPESPVLWSPERPHLYRFTVTAGEDEVGSYFALRTLSVETVKGKPRLCLNGEPYFFNGLLDQGYRSDGLYTPAAPELYAEDILAAKDMGFNTLRKHIKIEPERFYYDCDRLGMAVVQDMVNCGDYHFLRDTLLPTLGLQKRGDTALHSDPKLREHFIAAMTDTVARLRNHPCICAWTIFNEGWGQFRADDMYRALKELDPERFVDSTSGWFAQELSDVESRHIYFGALRLGKRPLPQVLSEFGGYVWKLPEHSFNEKKTYGYRIYPDRERYARALTALYEKLIPLAGQGLCAAIYTQLSDVEDETNGLLTYDRRVQKIDAGRLRPLAERLMRAVKR